MEKTLTFNTENERNGAEIIIDNALSRTSNRWYSKNYPDHLSIKYKNVPEVIFVIVQKHKHWPYIEEVGKFSELEEYLTSVEPRFDAADDIPSEIQSIKQELQEKIK